MPIFRTGQFVQRPSHVQSSIAASSIGNTASELAEDGTALASDFGFAEPATIDSDADSDYRVSSVISGFAPSVSDYNTDAITEEFPAICSYAYVLGKRAFDIIFALFAIAVASPLMILIAMAIKLTSRGPVFFLQDRVGQQGIFRMMKFRSMYLNDQSDTHHTSFGDPRITSVGTLLRRTSLDELPQLFNVLRGEMSIVGPRPELVRFVHKFQDEIPGYIARHIGKGGITGWAQVNGLRGSGTSIVTRIEYDLDYLRNWNFWMDLKIIFMTVCKGLVNNAF